MIFSRKKTKFVLYILIILVFFFVLKMTTQAQSCGNKEDCQKLINEYEQKLAETRKQKNTLASQIELMNTQIALATLRIRETEHAIVRTQNEIESLSGKIDQLNTSLDYLGKILIEKIAEGYKRRDIPLFQIFLDTEKASVLVNRMKYTRITQENDRKVAFQVQQAKTNFEEQKRLREQKQVELNNLKTTLNTQTVALNSQKAAKQQLLAVTQNDERTYQALLSRLRAEYAAIQGIIAGAGTETQLREVRKGDIIATIIPSASCNSSGQHLHFTILEGSSPINPFDKLKDTDHKDYSGGDTWNPHGDWDWPLSPSIEFHQGYGATSCVTSGYCGSIYSSHNGLDIFGSSHNVYAVADGTLYRGSYSVGCPLSYVKVSHRDSNITTLYLHVYSN